MCICFDIFVQTKYDNVGFTMAFFQNIGTFSEACDIYGTILFCLSDVVFIYCKSMGLYHTYSFNLFIFLLFIFFLHLLHFVSNVCLFFFCSSIDICNSPHTQKKVSITLWKTGNLTLTTKPMLKWLNRILFVVQTVSLSSNFGEMLACVCLIF